MFNGSYVAKVVQKHPLFVSAKRYFSRFFALADHESEVDCRFAIAFNVPVAVNAEQDTVRCTVGIKGLGASRSPWPAVVILDPCTDDTASFTTATRPQEHKFTGAL
jgi:hypothetical protein